MTNPSGSTAVATPSITALPVRQQVNRLAWPAMAEMLLMTLTHMVDMIMVGQLGPAAIAAVGLSTQPMFLLLGLFQALASGGTALVARAVGSGDGASANAIARQAAAATLVFGLLVGGLGWAASPAVPRLMGAELAVEGLAASYFRIIMLSMPVVTLTFVLGAVLRGSGDTRTPMVVNAITNLINVAGNYVLIFGHLGFPAMGVTGAALATAGARGVAGLLLLAFLISGSRRIHLSLRASYRPQRDLLRRILRVGVPAALEQLVMRTGQVVFVRLVAGLGTAVLAAHQIALSVEWLAFMPSFGFGMAAATLVGQGIGANRTDWSEKAAYETRRIGVFVLAAIGIGLLFFGEAIVRLYTRDPEVVAMGTQALRIMAVTQPFMAVNFIMAGSLRGAGDTRWPLLTTATGIWGVRVLLGYLLAVVAGLGLAGAWMAMAADHTVRAILLTLRFRAGRWKHLAI
ncbi:MAG TPA: MATE family efflux transporter [Bacillota bacterium]|nr:MATE family efflux transporter [Bacillota bacterium]